MSYKSTKSLLLELGITYDVNDKRGRKLMLYKDGQKIGYYSACEAHEKFCKNQNP